MDAAQAAQHIQEKIMPQLAEFGVEAFMVCGYLKDGDGKIHRVTFGYDGDHPAYADGLRPMQIMAAQWGAGKL